MIRLKKVLVATDLSPLSEYAIQHGCELAKQFGAELHLLTVVTYPFSQFAKECQQDYGRSIEDCEAQHLAECEQRLRAISVAPLDETKVTRIAKQGFPVAEIVRYVQTHTTDLLILGTHGLTGLRHVLMGSVAEEIVRTAPCPVLTVRDQSHRHEAVTDGN